METATWYGCEVSAMYLRRTTEALRVRAIQYKKHTFRFVTQFGDREFRTNKTF